MTSNDFNKMQQDAINRVAEMQRHAKKSLLTIKEPDKKNQFENQAYEKEPDRKGKNTETAHKHTAAEDAKDTKHKNHEQNKRSGFDFLKMFNFKNLPIDSDVALIFLLLLLFAGDDTDELMLLALVYIIL